MKNVGQLLKSLAVCLLVQATIVSAHATEVSIELSGVQGASMAGVYTDPYQLKISAPGQVLSQPYQFSNIIATANAFCDNFTVDTYLGEVWQGHVTNMSALTGSTSALSSLKFDTNASAATQQKDYMAMAWLAEQIVATNQSTRSGQIKAGEMSFALWNVFDNGPQGALSGLSRWQRKAASNYYNLAYKSVLADTPSDFMNVNIYTPDPRNASQEFLVVGQSSSSSGSSSASVPAPRSALLFAAALGALLVLSLALRKRQQKARK